VYKAIGRPDILLKMTILTLVLLASTLFFGSRFGLHGVAWAYVVAVSIERIVSLYIATKIINISLKEILSQLLPSLKGGLIMAGATLAVLYLLANADPLIQLFCVVLTGVVSYLGVLWRSEKDSIIQLTQMIRKSD
jgi:PST family polysaccharide transporter